MQLNREHFRAIIFNNYWRVVTQQQCIAELNSIFGDEAPSRTSVSRWYGKFNWGRSPLQEEFREGRPKSVVISKTINVNRAIHRLRTKNNIAILYKTAIKELTSHDIKSTIVWNCLKKLNRKNSWSLWGIDACQRKHLEMYQRLGNELPGGVLKFFKEIGFEYILQGCPIKFEESSIYSRSRYAPL